MKLLYIPLQPGDPDTDDLYKAFCKKYEVHFYGNECNASPEAINFNPDIVYIHSGALPLQTVKYIKENTNAIWAQWTGDCSEGSLLEPVLRYKDITDVTFLASGGHMSTYQKELNQPVHWMPHAVAEWQFRPVKEKTQGIVFVGNNYTHYSGGVERYELNQQLAKCNTHPFRLYGNGWEFGEPAKWETLPDIYNQYLIGLSNNLINDVDLYFSNRPLNIMAAGSLCLMRRVPGIDQYFTHGKDCIMYVSVADAIYQLENMHKHDRNAIAAEGQQTVRRHFMYENIVDIFQKHT